MSKNDIKSQFRQSLTVLAAIVGEFSNEEWISGGCGYQTPVRLAFHALSGIGYYTDYTSKLEASLGKNFDEIPAEDLPSREEIDTTISEAMAHIDRWIEGLSLEDNNERFPWAGETNTGLMLFVLRHTMYHIGELNSLIYQIRNGNVGDLWMKGLEE